MRGDDVVCDLYRIPVSIGESESALLTVRMKSCQKLESPEQIYADCFDNPGEDKFQMGDNQGFFIDGYTGPNGIITLQLPPGTYRVSGIYGHTIGGTYRYCSQMGKPESGFDGTPVLQTGEHWICDIYIQRESFR